MRRRVSRPARYSVEIIYETPYPNGLTTRSVTLCDWSSCAVCRRRRSTGASPLYAGCTGSRTSNGGSERTRPSTSANAATGRSCSARDGERLGRRTAHPWVNKTIGKKDGLGHVIRTCLGASIMGALDAGVALRDLQTAACDADSRRSTIYDCRRENFDRHTAHIVVAFVAGA